MTTEQEETLVAFPFEEAEITVNTDKGPFKARAFVHEFAPGIAVTMNHFGVFDVTHIATGLLVARGYERMANAAVALLELANCADWTLPDAKALVEQIEAHGDESADVPSCTVTSKDGKRPMTKRELVGFIRTQNAPLDEFPWEDEDTSPHHAIDRIIDHMAAKRAAQQQPAASPTLETEQ